MKAQLEALADAITYSLQRDGDYDNSLGGAVDDLAREVGKIADAITPTHVAPGQDENGGHVGCLTEAVMGVTGGLMAIASAIQELAEAVGNSRK
jgi:hypothetical protein